MADEGNGVPKLHPDDLAALQQGQTDRFEELVRAMARGPLRTPGSDETPTPRGIDAYVIQQTVQALIDGKISGFLTRDQIRVLVLEVMAGEETFKRFVRIVDERLGSIGLRMDDDHIDATGDAIRGAVRWHRLASRMFMTAISTIGLGLLYELLKKLGFNIPTGS